MYRYFALALLAITLPCGAGQAAEREFSAAGREVTEWTAAPGYYEKAPVLVFSHGLYGCPAEARHLMQAFAAKGFWVFAPHHSDALCGSRQAQQTTEKETKFSKPNAWDAKTYADRKDDLAAVLDALRQDEERSADLDLSHIALMGYELGGYTVLGMAGAWPEWKKEWNREGVRAILTFSPYIRPFNQQKSWAGLDLPVMLQGGAKDPHSRHLHMVDTGAYGQITASKYLALVRDATASDWMRDSSPARDPIIRYSLAFLQYYLTGEESPVLRQGSDRVTYAYTSEAGERPLEEAKSRPPQTIRRGNSTSQTIKGGNSGGESTLRSGDWRDRNRGDSTFQKTNPFGENE